jgi:hypothetical protein
MISRRVDLPDVLYLFAERIEDEYFTILGCQVDKVFGLYFFQQTHGGSGCVLDFG